MSVSRMNGVILGFLLVELFGEVQDKRNEAVSVRLLPHVRCRCDATIRRGRRGRRTWMRGAHPRGIAGGYVCRDSRCNSRDF